MRLNNVHRTFSVLELMFFAWVLIYLRGTNPKTPQLPTIVLELFGPSLRTGHTRISKPAHAIIISINIAQQLWLQYNAIKSDHTEWY